MGPPGSGKGTLSALCVKQFGWNQVSTGNLCRSHIQSNTLIGQKMKSAIEQGQLVPDDVIADMIQEWMLTQKESDQNVIFDGYPRTKKQAELLYALVKNNLKESELALIKFQVDSDVLVDRILSRVVCSNKDCQQAFSLKKDAVGETMKCKACGSSLIKRSDDTRDTLVNRLGVYYQHEQDILDFYEQQGISIEALNGAGDIADVFQDFKKLTERA